MIGRAALLSQILQSAHEADLQATVDLQATIDQRAEEPTGSREIETPTGDPRADKTPNALTGDLGTGKTSVLRHLHDHPGTLSSVYIDMQDFDPGHRGEYGATASVGAVQSSFLQLRAALSLILVQVADDGSGEELVADLQAAADRAYRRRVLKADASSTEFNAADLISRIEQTALAKAWQRALKEMCGQFLLLWNGAAAGGKYLLLADNWDFVSEQQIGLSLDYVFTKMNATTVVSARRGPKVEGRFRTGHLDEDDVHKWLVDELGLSRPVAHLVFDVTTGHPATLVLAVALLTHRERYSSRLTAFLESLLDHHFPRRAGLMAERLARELGGDPLVEALQLSAVPRQFDAALLAHLLGDQHPRTELVRLVTTLAAIYEPVPFPRRRPKADNVGVELVREPARASAAHEARAESRAERYRMHSFVRNSLLDRMSTGASAGRFEEINESIVAYYRDRVLDDEGNIPGVAGSYGKAYVYEDRSWQAHKREWLYHRGLTNGAAAKQEALREFATVFLDAFYWWGYYIRFEFCEQLVTDLEHLAERRTETLPGWDRDGGTNQSWPELVRLHQSLRAILEKYPTGSEKPATAEWDDIRKSLLTVSDLCRVNVDRWRISADDSGAHLAGVIYILLAHTFRYQDPQQEDADYCYAIAADLLTERWMQPWLSLERGELSYEGQRLGDVEAHWRAAIDLLRPARDQDEDDKEVRAWLFSLRANCAVVAAKKAAGGVDGAQSQDSDRESRRLYLRAARWHGRAVWQAYLFHFSVGPPDAYTLEFYVDLRRRALNFLRALPKSADDSLTFDCAAQMAAAASADSRYRPREGHELRDALDAGSPIELAHALFPRGPDVDELTTSATEFSAEHQSYTRSFRRPAEPEPALEDQWP